MEGLEMSFGEAANVHFHHLLNFDTFKAEMPDDSANVAGIVRRSEPNSINDSLNTPISGFMDLPIFFGPSVVLPLPSVLTGKRERAKFSDDSRLAFPPIRTSRTNDVTFPDDSLGRLLLSYSGENCHLPRKENASAEFRPTSFFSITSSVPFLSLFEFFTRLVIFLICWPSVGPYLAAGRAPVVKMGGKQNKRTGGVYLGVRDVIVCFISWRHPARSSLASHLFLYSLRESISSRARLPSRYFPTSPHHKRQQVSTDLLLSGSYATWYLETMALAVRNWWRLFHLLFGRAERFKNSNRQTIDSHYWFIAMWWYLSLRVSVAGTTPENRSSFGGSARAGRPDQYKAEFLFPQFFFSSSSFLFFFSSFSQCAAEWKQKNNGPEAYRSMQSCQKKNI